MQPRMTKATVRLTKDWEYVAGMEPMILLSLNYEKQAGKLYLAIIKVSNLKILQNNKKPGTGHFLLEYQTTPLFVKND